MLLLVLVLLLVAFVLSVLFWIGSLWLQTYIYEAPAQGLAWRAPAAGAALGLFLAVWCFLDYGLGVRQGGSALFLDTPWNFTPTESYPPEPFKEFISVKNGKETVYVRRPTGQPIGAQYHYVDKETNKPWSRESNGLVEAIIVEKDGEKVRYNLDLPGGKFQPGQPARYVEEGGRYRVLTENDVQTGQTTHFHTGWFVANLVVNGLYFAAWFVCVWLLLRFQWAHALGLAVVFWLIMTLAVFPPVLTMTRKAVPAQPVVKPTAMLGGARRGNV
jgi:hypothetical protein